MQNAIDNIIPDNELDAFGSVNDKSTEKLLYKSTKNLEYIVKFIIRSRTLFAELNSNKDKVEFEHSLEGDSY